MIRNKAETDAMRQGLNTMLSELSALEDSLLKQEQEFYVNIAVASSEKRSQLEADYRAKRKGLEARVRS